MNYNSESHREELNSTEKELLDTGSCLDRLYDAVESGKVSLDDLAPRIHERKERQLKLQARKDELSSFLSGRKAEVASREEVAECANSLREILEENSFAERKAFIRSFVKEVKVKEDNVLLTYTLPMLPGKMTEEKVPVLSIVHYGGEAGTRTPTPCGTWS